MTAYTPAGRLWEGVQGDPAIANAWGTPLSENFTLIEAMIDGLASVPIGGLSTYTLTTVNGGADEARPLLQSFTGALTGACTVTIPNAQRYGWVQNATTGGFSVTLTSGGSTNGTIPPDGARYQYWCDGSGNVRLPSMGFGTILVQSASTFYQSVSIGTGLTVLSGTTALDGPVTVGGGIGGALTVATGSPTTLNGGGTVVGGLATDTLSLAGTQADVTVTPNSASGTTGTLAISEVATPPAANSLVSLNLARTDSVFTTYEYVGSVVGTVTTTGTATSYNTTSDARLKVDDGRIDGAEASSIIKRLAPRWFRWKSRERDAPEPGFFAQQAHRVFPWAVSKGTGRIGSRKFRPWQMDNSKLLPLVVAALQDALARIEVLEKGR